MKNCRPGKTGRLFYVTGGQNEKEGMVIDLPNIIDACGLACPQPVVLTKKALAALPDALTVKVDNPAARENVVKLAASEGYAATVTEKDGTFELVLAKAGAGVKAAGPVGEMAILVKSNRFGEGDPKLGEVLMKSFMFVLTESDLPLKHLIFMNKGVFLTTEGSELLGYLAALEDQGVAILSCGTCLDYYGLQEKLAVGKVTNMYTALEIMGAAAKTLVF
ncbi:MAG: sulfurtransferase-like selenium metabolism protein YedF [Heliobacteriaceae bacterium]|nr:sulfurtransferase-like selenium metabolism protein YedF [Heliobacteriaceae bacterium]MDD4588253.1 sulfurtransferase-like selenium metabolism protein YedF [Heliobacteriaceae bacterium]